MVDYNEAKIKFNKENIDKKSALDENLNNHLDQYNATRKQAEDLAQLYRNTYNLEPESEQESQPESESEGSGFESDSVDSEEKDRLPKRPKTSHYNTGNDKNPSDKSFLYPITSISIIKNFSFMLRLFCKIFCVFAPIFSICIVFGFYFNILNVLSGFNFIKPYLDLLCNLSAIYLI